MNTVEQQSPAARAVPDARRGAAKPRAMKPAREPCRHCGVPVADEGAEFCCPGCAYVHRLINEAGLEAYYQIKDKVTAPADAALLPSREYGWLSAAQAAAEESAGTAATPELRLDVQGISCAGCVWLIERIFSRLTAEGRVEVNAQTGQLRLLWSAGHFDAAAFARELQSFNYLVSPASAKRAQPPESKGLVRRIGLCGAFAMNVMLFTLPTYFGMSSDFAYAGLFGTLSMAFATLSLFAGGGYFLGRAWRGLREGIPTIDLPIALGVLGAFGGSFFGWLSGQESFVYFDFVSTFILLMLVGRWAQLAAVEHNQRRLLAEQPTPATVRLADAALAGQELPVEKIEPETSFLLGRGQTSPVEGRLCSAEATVSLAWINGEAEPRVFRAGQRIPSGAVNLGRAEIKLQATEGWKHSLLAELTRPVQRADYRHRFLERVIKGYLVAIIAGAFLSGAGWLAVTGDALRSWSVVTAVLVVSCPCAIGLAFPLADEIAAVALRRRGVFVRVPDLWPRLAKVKRVIFDKTGTLTLDVPKLLEPERTWMNLGGTERRALLALVAENPHPVARSLHEQLLERGEGEPLRGAIEETIGQGMRLRAGHDGTEWRLGRRSWALLGEVNSAAPDGQPGRAGTVLGRDGQLVAEFEFIEAARPDAAVEIAHLHRRGLAISILSGDESGKVDKLVSTLGLPRSAGTGQMDPHDKAQWVRSNQAGESLMLGDGANDSLAFDEALCRGTPVVHRGVLSEKADFYYLGRGVAGIRALFEVDDARRRTQRWLLVFSISYNLCAVGLAVAGMMNPLVAAILMPVSSLATLAVVGAGMSRAGRS
jgi:P-type Cu2+ transporter